METGGSELILCKSLINLTKQFVRIIVLNSSDLITDFTGPKRVFTASTSVKKIDFVQVLKYQRSTFLKFHLISDHYTLKKKLVTKHIYNI